MVRFILERKLKLFFAVVFSTLILGISAVNVYPDNGYGLGVVAKDKQWVINDWHKGLNTKLSSLSLPSNQGDICENVRFDPELKSLTKRNDIFSYGTADTSEPITGMHRLYLKDGTKVLLVTHGDELEKGNDNTGAFTSILDLATADYRWQWETWHNIGIGTDGYNQPVKYDGSSGAATYLGTCLAVDADSGAGPNGTYSYKVTYYTTSYEVAFDVASNSVTVTDNDISLSMIPIAPDTYGGEDVTGRKIYRIKNGGSTYYLLSNGTIANNTATTLTDSDADGELTATVYPVSPDATYTPPKGKLILVHRNRLWIAHDPSNPSRLYYSEDSNPDVFVSDSYFNIRRDDGDTITFIKNLLGILVVGKENSIQLMDTLGADPAEDWAISAPYSFVGCQAMYSADNSPMGIIYLAREGLYRFDGQRSHLISDCVTPEIKDILSSNFDDAWGKWHQNKYYLAYSSKSIGEDENNRVLVFDQLSDAYSIDLLSINAFCSFNSGTDWGVLYGGSSEDGTVYAFSFEAQEIKHNKHSDFDKGTFDDARYLPIKRGGKANSPIIEIAWDCTIDGWLAEIQANEAGVSTIDEIAESTTYADSIIDRPDKDGTYTSPVMYVGANSFDKLYWNETIPAAGGDVTFNIRAGASSAACQSASWSSAFSDATGSDISSLTANDYVQYKINLSTDDIDYTPTLYRLEGYVVKLTYYQQGSAAETSVPMHWRSGWTNLGAPGYKKSLKKLYVFHEGTEGTLTLTFENYEGDTDVFEINLIDNPEYYTEYFTTGKFIGEKFRLDIENDDLHALKIKEIIVIYDIEPLV